MTNERIHAGTTTRRALLPTRSIVSQPPVGPGPRRNGQTWLKIAGGAAVLVVAVVAAAGAISSGGDDPADAVPPATEQIDIPNGGHDPADEIKPATEQIDGAVVERDAVSDPEVRRPTYLIIQDEIDAALEERKARAAVTASE